MNGKAGRSPLRGSGHSPKGGASISVESPAKPSVPNAARLLWRAGSPNYPDLVFVTETGDIGMKADFGRAEVRSIGRWCYLATEVARLSAGYAAFPRDVAAVLGGMGDDESVLSAADISSETDIPEKRVKEIRRALKVLGLARFGPLCDSDAEGYVARGSGYWATLTGEQLSSALYASGIETEGQDNEDWLGAEPESPTGEAGDAQHD